MAAGTPDMTERTEKPEMEEITDTAIHVGRMRKISYNPLWKKLIDVKLNKTELAEKAGVARSTIGKMAKDQIVSLDVILKICNYLDCGIEDVVSILPK